MELRQLNYFLAVVEHGGISQAAMALGMTQPNLSRQIKALEVEWGWQLFERKGRGVKLTRKGEVSYREMKKVSRVMEQSLKSMHRENGVKKLRVGYAPSLASSILEKAVSVYRQCHPRVLISLDDCSMKEMSEGLESGKLDVVIGAEFESDTITWHSLYELEHVMVCKENHQLVTRTEVTPEELVGEHLLMFSRLDYPGYWHALTNYFDALGVNAKVAGEFDGIESLLTAMRAGLGVAILTRMLPKALIGGLVKKELSVPFPALQVSVGVASFKAPEAYVVEFLNECQKSLL